MRKFYYVKRIKDKDFKLPERSTSKSAGYDIFACEDFIIMPDRINIIETGIKAQMEDDEMLVMANRSSNPLKRGIYLSSGINIIDADYYNNEDNEGEISLIIQTTFKEPVVIRKNEKICQCVFMKYLTTEDDNSTGIRKSGIGSTGK